MKIEFNNLYTHFILITKNRKALITESQRERIEKYITGIVNNNSSRLYAIYANPEHVHMLLSRSPKFSEETLATIVAESVSKFINENKLCLGKFDWQDEVARISRTVNSVRLKNKNLILWVMQSRFVCV